MRNDVLLNEDYDIIDDGEEWLEGESEDTDVELILLCSKGENREFVAIGFGINNQLKKRIEPQQFYRDMEVELENDGFAKAQIIEGDTLGDFKIII